MGGGVGTEGVVVRGVGADAPLVEHANGSKESFCPFALDVIPRALREIHIAHLESVPNADPPEVRLLTAIEDICVHLEFDVTTGVGDHLIDAGNAVLDALAPLVAGRTRYAAMLEVGRVLELGERKYGGDENWRGITVRQHCRHALAHIHAHLAGDEQEGELGHLTHALCRICFAIEVEIRAGAQ